jgi:hypothetical protein
MTINELIEKLEDIGSNMDLDMEVGATFFNGPTEGSILMASLDLSDILIADDRSHIVLRFNPVPIVTEAMKIALSIQHVINGEISKNSIGLEEDDEEEDDGGLPY